MKKLTDLLDIFTQTLAPDVYAINQEIPISEIEMLCQKHHFHLSFIDGQNIKNKADFLEYCSVKMNFPDYFGQNWDGFEDCLTDQLLSAQQPYFIFYTQANKLAENHPTDWKKLLDIWQSSIEFLQTQKIDLYVVLQSS